MGRPSRLRAFSLLEVVIAVGIFAVAITVILALLPSLTRQSADSADALAAQRLPDAVRVELRRLSTSDFSGFATTVPVMAAPLANGLSLVASRNGARLHSTVFLPPAAGQVLPQSDQYFAIEVWRFGSGALQYDATAAVLPAYVRISWPYYNPGSTTPSALADRSQFTFTVSINR